MSKSISEAYSGTNVGDRPVRNGDDGISSRIPEPSESAFPASISSPPDHFDASQIREEEELALGNNGEENSIPKSTRYYCFHDFFSCNFSNITIHF